MSLQGEIVYILFWILLLIVPIIAGIKRYWIAAVIYLMGTLIFAANLLKVDTGWNDLANFATLLVVVLPIYLVGTLLWVWSVYRRQ